MTWSDNPQDEIYFAEVARLDAGLGRKEDAIREARQAVGYKRDRAVLCAQADRASIAPAYSKSRTQLTARR